MTAEQLTLDWADCEPAWTTDDALVVLHGWLDMDTDIAYMIKPKEQQ